MVAVVHADTARGPVELAPVGSSVTGLVLDDAYVYWSELGLPSAAPYDSTILRVAKVGGPRQVLAAHQPEVRGMAVAEGHVYFGSYKDGTVLRVPSAGGRVERIVTGQGEVGEVAVKGGELFWLADRTRLEPPGMTRSLVRMSLASGVQSVVLASTTTASGAPASFPHRLGAFPSGVYWCTMAGGATATASILRQAASGAAPTTLLEVDPLKALENAIQTGAVTADGVDVPFIGCPEQLAANRSHVVWINTGAMGGGSLWALPLAGGPAAKLARVQRPRSLAIDDTTALVTDAQSETVMKVPLRGGQPEVVGRGQKELGPIATDSTGIYWVANHAIMKLPRPTSLPR